MDCRYTLDQSKLIRPQEYIGFDKSLKRPVSIKIQSIKDVSIMEIDCLFRLFHPHILHGSDILSQDNCVSSATTIGVVIPSDKRNLSTTTVEERFVPIIAAQLLEAAYFLSSQSLVHLSIIPSNVLLYPHGVVLTGLNFVVLEDTVLPSLPSNKLYLPPEAKFEQKNYIIDEKIMVWSIGAIISELNVVSLKPLVEGMLQWDPDKRWSINTCLKWLNSPSIETFYVIEPKAETTLLLKPALNKFIERCFSPEAKLASLFRAVDLYHLLSPHSIHFTEAIIYISGKIEQDPVYLNLELTDGVSTEISSLIKSTQGRFIRPTLYTQASTISQLISWTSNLSNYENFIVSIPSNPKHKENMNITLREYDTFVTGPHFQPESVFSEGPVSIIPRKMVTSNLISRVNSLAADCGSSLDGVFDYLAVYTVNNEIYGFLTLTQTEDVMEVYDVCVGFNSRNKGVGKTLMKTITTYSQTNRLWLCVLFTNPYFEAAVRLYVSSGFLEPYITSSSITGTKLPWMCLSLTYTSKLDWWELPNSKREVLMKSTFDRVRDIVLAYQQANMKLCETTIFMEKSLTDNLKTLLEQEHEVAGAFYIDSYYQNIALLKVDELSLIKGEKDNVDIPFGRIVFHSHPYICYSLSKCPIQWPSAMDLGAVMFNRNLDIIINFVITLEGIYTVEVTPEFAFVWDQLSKKCQLDLYYFLVKKFDYYDILYSAALFNIPNTTENIYSAVKSYIDRINNYSYLDLIEDSNEYKKFTECIKMTNTRDIVIFKVQFSTWDFMKEKNGLKVITRPLLKNGDVCPLRELDVMEY